MTAGRVILVSFTRWALNFLCCMKHISNNFLAGSSAIAVLLVFCASVPGLLGIISYPLETADWRAQCVMQDQLNVGMVLPLLLVSTLLALKNKVSGKYLWAACMGYLAYTFTIYCFCIHFNEMFIAYCGCWSVSVFSFGYFLVMHQRENGPAIPMGLLKKMAVYFMSFAVVVAMVWLSEIIPAITSKKMPASVERAGLFTNAVYVLDLAILLPGVFITGMLLRKQRALALSVTPVVLLFFVLMAATVGYMSFQNTQEPALRWRIAGVVTSFVLIQLLLLRYWQSATEKRILLKSDLASAG